MALPKAKETHGPVKSAKRSTAVKKYAPCPLSHEPNEETKQTIREARQGIGVTRCKDMDEFRRRLLED